MKNANWVSICQPFHQKLRDPRLRLNGKILRITGSGKQNKKCFPDTT